MTHLTPIRPTEHPFPGIDTAPMLRPSELADRMRAAYIEVGCPSCAHPRAVQVCHLKDVTRAEVTCDGCGTPYCRDHAVSLTLLTAIGWHLP
jgi:ribosomal protein S27E